MPKKKKLKPSKYGIHKRKFNGKLFRSYGAGGHFTNKEAAERLAKAERGYGCEARVVPVEDGHRVFLRDKPKKRKKR